jgi:two-component system phosphate regulon response regulator OmpR
MDGQAHVAVVDDEPDLRESICEYLGMHGFETTPCANGAELTRLLERGPTVDVALLDINMPGEDGLSIARRLRDMPGRPAVIMVTAAGATVDRIIGLELGADDYLAKPVELRELLARVRSVVRRRRGPAAPPPAAPAPVAAAPATASIRFAGFTLDPDARRLTDPEGVEVPLTAMEFDLLHALATRPNRVLSRESLLEIAHGKEVDPFDRSIDVRITRLRRKIEPDPAAPSFIRTVRGTGYVFVPDGRDP